MDMKNALKKTNTFFIYTSYVNEITTILFQIVYNQDVMIHQTMSIPLEKIIYMKENLV